MSLATLTSKEVSRVQKLIERKEALAQQIGEINRELEAIESGVAESARPANPTARPLASPKAAAPRPAKAAASAIPRGKARPGKTAQGGLKERITAELKSAGKTGMKVKDLATKLGTSYGNITNFFQNAGKNMKEIKKVGPGRFAWVGV